MNIQIPYYEYPQTIISCIKNTLFSIKKIITSNNLDVVLQVISNSNA